jgi:beta-galactosidase
MNKAWIIKCGKTVVFWGVIFSGTYMSAAAETEGNSEFRKVICLDGVWQIAEGTMNTPPKEYSAKGPVPGLADMAEPAFEQVGVKNDKREAFWYRREFAIDGELPARVMLLIHKAKYGTAVYLNGRHVGEHWPCFTPVFFDVRDSVHGGGRNNELLIRVGANRESLPPKYPDGWDFEKCRYIPGIYDSVELILTGAPFISDVQVAPDVENQRARVAYAIHNPKKLSAITVQKTIFDVRTKQAVRMETATIENAGLQVSIARDEWVDMAGCRLWTPEEPYLYAVELKTTGDAVTTRFGMRSFTFDPATGRAMLNGKPYFMRGTNVCIDRFFEDSQRGDLPWRKDWVRKLHQRFKTMHWNSIRYCIGFPPDFWYDIADEEGFLIQDEFPIWHIFDHWPAELTADELISEFTDWLHQRWNHPCAIIWDVQNETLGKGRTDEAIQKVRTLDLSHRPWDNGWDAPQADSDPTECHPYYFFEFKPPFDENRYAAYFSQAHRPDENEYYPNYNANKFHGAKDKPFHNAALINEYGWLWINRNGSATPLSKDFYAYFLGENATAEQRRYLYARQLAAETEYWRSHRKVAGVLQFCGLGYTRPGEEKIPITGATSDNWIDVDKLVFEPSFSKIVGDAFAPVDVMIDLWRSKYPAGSALEAPVAVINDRYEKWSGTVRLRLIRDGMTIDEKSQPCEVDPLGRQRLSYGIDIPNQTGQYLLEAALLATGHEVVRSLRDIEALTNKK